MDSKELSYKLVLLGDAAVGKSSLVERFASNSFFEFCQPTIGAAFVQRKIQLDDVTIKFDLWDTAGQERYRSLAPMYYRNAAAALVVYDITTAETFKGAQDWIEELQRQGNTDIVIGLAGNKMDLDIRREVATEDAKRFAESNGCVFFETSAKSGANVTQIFLEIARRLPQSQAPAPTDGLPDTTHEDGPCRC